MSRTIKPGQVVLAAALPLPMEGLTVLHAAVEALYGTGEIMLDMGDGDLIRVLAPKDGFGPRAHGAAQPFVDVSDGMKLRSVKLDNEHLSMTLEDAHDTIAHLSLALTTWFDSVGAINYAQSEFVNPDQENAKFFVTVQRAGHPTAHDLRGVAEDRVAVLEGRLRELGGDLS
jgi:hypothetical protein